MPHTDLCHASEIVSSDTCPRLTTGAASAAGERTFAEIRQVQQTRFDYRETQPPVNAAKAAVQVHALSLPFLVVPLRLSLPFLVVPLRLSLPFLVVPPLFRCLSLWFYCDMVYRPPACTHTGTLPATAGNNLTRGLARRTCTSTLPPTCSAARRPLRRPSSSRSW